MKEFDDHELLTNEADQQWYRENMELGGLKYNKYLWIKMEPTYFSYPSTAKQLSLFSLSILLLFIVGTAIVVALFSLVD